MDREHSSTSVWFLCGLAAGTIGILLFAPGVGERARRSLTEGGSRTWKETGLEWFHRGRELYKRGREIAEDAAEFFERHQRLPESASDETI